ncbi:MAG: Maf family protein [Pyrinomonadaceae bacterium]|nr:Maf family protein [Pyrinomonadaceae bacterium]MCX7639086.1 Maf family protein [Pyrinomonadaceae bacterium]MDW8303693.1 Maf family protein [Acidobacteriota bacterium]
MKLPKIILASSSPRRAEILKSVGWEFEKDVADIDETATENETPEDYVVRLAKSKASAVASKYSKGVVLGADTTVVIDGKILGKPENLEQARRMLRALSNRWHQVLTGVAIVEKSDLEFRAITAIEKTSVKFANMSEEEIEFLIENGEPLDKAGAYAVQAQAALFIERIEGDYWNVVGLPIHLVYKLIKQISSSTSNQSFAQVD